MQALLDVVLPVFLVLGLGYAARWRKLIGEGEVDALMRFTQGFAIPCLLFLAIARLDLHATFHPALLFSYYAAAIAAFLLGMFGARTLFARPWEDSVAIGMCCLYSNSVLLGLPIAERAYGAATLASNYAIVALHAPVCYAIGITVMEVVRARGSGLVTAARTVSGALATNALMIGIALGFLVNLTGLAVPGVVEDGLELMARAALPAALFGLGGVLFGYRPEGDALTILFICAVSLLITPALAWLLSRELSLAPEPMRAAVITAATPPGVNAYLFASMYGVARRVAASSVLAGTMASLVTIWLWLAVLP
ncbi:MAG: AEC family transporter [Alphaproteobacteria bacterium]|nr:MAG: AEC family transporter [Alphaproteobacteria bacterium]